MDWQSTARRQHGMITRRQLAAHGASDRQVRTLLAHGHLVTDAVHGVYRSTTVPTSRWSLAWAAVLAARAVLCHRSAAVAWGVDVPHGRTVEVTVPDRRRTAWPPGVRVHRVRISALDVTELGGLPITSRSRTVIDCLGVLPIATARTLFDRAVQQRWIEVADVRRRLIGEPGRWGNQQIRALLAEATLGESVAERVLHTILREAGIGGWEPNAPLILAGRLREVDVLFRAARLVLEVDGMASHVGPERFQDDRRRQNDLIAAGYRVLRFTWRDLIERPGGVAREIRAALARAA